MHRTPRSAAARPVVSIALTAVTVTGLVLSAVAAPAAAAEPVLTAGVDGIITLPAADGFKDAATLSVSSDTAGTVRPEILDGEDVVVKTLDDVVLADGDTDGSFTGTVSLVSLGIAAGDYTVKVTDTSVGTASATAQLTVGSGKIVSTSVAASPTFFPHKDGYLDTVKARVVAYDETGTAVPYTGFVTVNRGSTASLEKPIASTTGASASALVSVASFPVGTGLLRAHLTGPDGSYHLSDALPITLAYTKVATVAVSKNISTVLPAADSFQDTGTITVSTTSSTGTTIPVTGKVAISLNGTTVKSWALTSSGSKSFTWNGLNGGKIVPGKYTVTVSAKGPQGSTKTGTMYINVSAKKLVTKTYKRTYDADYVIDEWEETQVGSNSRCLDYTASPGKMRCIGLAADMDGISLYALGSVDVPSVVRASPYNTSVRITANVDRLTAPVGWGYTNDGEDGPAGGLFLGNSDLGWMRVVKSNTFELLVFALGEETDLILDHFVVEYRYKVLQ